MSAGGRRHGGRRDAGTRAAGQRRAGQRQGEQQQDERGQDERGQDEWGQDEQGRGGRRNSADRLLDAAGALMIERDSVNITFADIAERSGLNSALIHYRFGGKPGLFRALLERDVGGVLVQLDELVAAPRDAAQKLRLHVHGVIRTYRRYPYVSRLVAAMTADAGSESARFIAERFTRPIADAHAAILRQGLAEGRFRAVDADLFYFTLFGACEHLFSARHSLRWAFGVDAIDEALSRRYADQVADTLLGGIAVSG